MADAMELNMGSELNIVAAACARVVTRRAERSPRFFEG